MTLIEDANKRLAEYRERDKQRQRDKELSDIKYALVRYAKKRAKKKGVECSIRPEDVPDIPDVCPILGIPLVKQKGRFKANSPSLDRVDSKKGYVVGNVQVISWQANLLKGEHMTLDIAKKLVEYLEKHSKQGR